ncbi:hypothetical protein [Streptomyces sp. NPDC051677]|uniref:hypothetical protein n=1 Tax=Streptomyces sp. NPDC051677 TaxID=3365669 RepID=UPI0037D0C28B
MDLTAYRIIQKALTKATKRAADHAAHARLTFSDSRLLISVSNGGGAVTPTIPGGYGLLGMRERAHSVGGDLHACLAPKAASKSPAPYRSSTTSRREARPNDERQPVDRPRPGRR